PNPASMTGASIPAAAWVAPSPGAGSRTTTSAPAHRARQAAGRPTIPAPTTTTSWVDALICCSLRWHAPDQVRRSAPCALSAPCGAPVHAPTLTRVTDTPAYTRGVDATSDPRARLADARLYLCTDAREETGDLEP